jgi:hypothetical protein
VLCFNSKPMIEISFHKSHVAAHLQAHVLAKPRLGEGEEALQATRPDAGGNLRTPPRVGRLAAKDAGRKLAEGSGLFY